MLSSRFLRWLGSVAAVAVAATAAVVTGLPAHAAVPFTPYNQTNFANAGILGKPPYDMPRSTVIYNPYNTTCSATTCTNIPTRPVFRKYVQDQVAHYGTSGHITLDFETLVLKGSTSDAQAQRRTNLYRQLIEWTRELYPNAKLGIYDYEYGYSGDRNTTIRKGLYDTGLLNYFAPTMYQRWGDHATWKANLEKAIKNDRAISSSLPIYPYIAPFPGGHYDSGKYLSQDEWKAELADLKASDANGFILWSGAKGADGNPLRIDENHYWAVELKTFLGNL